MSEKQSYQHKQVFHETPYVFALEFTQTLPKRKHKRFQNGSSILGTHFLPDILLCTKTYQSNTQQIRNKQKRHSKPDNKQTMQSYHMTFQTQCSMHSKHENHSSWDFQTSTSTWVHPIRPGKALLDFKSCLKSTTKSLVNAFPWSKSTLQGFKGISESGCHPSPWKALLQPVPRIAAPPLSKKIPQVTWKSAGKNSIAVWKTFHTTKREPVRFLSNNTIQVKRIHKNSWY